MNVFVYTKHCPSCGGLMTPVLVSEKGTQWSCNCGHVENDGTIYLSYSDHTVIGKERKEDETD